MRHVEVRQRLLLLHDDDPHHGDQDGVPDGGILVQRGHHVHDGQQVLGQVDVLVELRHGQIRHDQGLHVARRTDGPLDALTAGRFGGTGRSARMVTGFATALYDHLLGTHKREKRGGGAFGNFLPVQGGGCGRAAHGPYYLSLVLPLEPGLGDAAGLPSSAVVCMALLSTFALLLGGAILRVVLLEKD